VNADYYERENARLQTVLDWLDEQAKSIRTEMATVDNETPEWAILNNDWRVLHKYFLLAQEQQSALYLSETRDQKRAYERWQRTVTP
jgi:hypothetical protein